jgi:hypothetical protein
MTTWRKGSRCEGYRRKHNFMTLGGRVEWEQCTNEAIMVLEVKQDEGIGKFPACEKCYEECKEREIEILSKVDL